MVTLTFLQLSHHIISGIDTNSLTAVSSATTAPIPNTESQESDSAVAIAASDRGANHSRHDNCSDWVSGDTGHIQKKS